MPRLNGLQKALIVVLFAVLLAGVAGPSLVKASVPTGAPSFTNPLNITNTYAPFKEGAIKVYRGMKGGKVNVVVDNYLATTRTFTLGSTEVATHIIEEIEFLRGELSEISRNHFAQADNGAVYYFGEVVDEFTDGAITGHEGSWLVGGPTLPSDPSTTANAPAPTVFMPAIPEKGDVFKQEDLLPVVDETDTVKAVNLKVRVEAARFTNVIRIRETSQIAGSPPENKWYAPNVGVIRSRARREQLQLIASTLVQ